MAMGRRFTGPSGRAGGLEVPRVGRRLGVLGLFREDGLDELRHEDAVVVDEGLERDAGRGDRDDGVGGKEVARERVAEVVAGAKHQGDGAVELAELDDFRLLRGDREDDDLLLAVEDRLRARVRGWRSDPSVPVSAGGGGSSVPTTCTPWSSALTLVPFTPATVVMVASSGLTVTIGKLVGGEADDHVDEVAGLGQRADARDLVHLDRHADEGRSGSRCG